jgi:hypothetical protein
VIEQYLVRSAGAGPDLVWVAEVVYDPLYGWGEVIHCGELEGHREWIFGRLHLEHALAAARNRGYQVDRLA